MRKIRENDFSFFTRAGAIFRQEKLHKMRNIFHSELTLTEAEREGEAAVSVDQEMIESEYRV